MSNVKIAFVLSAFASAMLTLALFSAPLYDTFCRVTGFGGTTQIATEAPERVSARQMRIRFDANVNIGSLEFRPLEAQSEIALGAHALAFYEVTNTSNKPVSAIASYNVTPHKAGLYFNKLECFCFQERVFAAGETKTLPVVFFVSPDLEAESDLDDVSTITLSYTFHPIGDPGGAAK
ncbi:MAG: cytochrome c oxidase assembly protein [Pseudomonadota bacterium]